MSQMMLRVKTVFICYHSAYAFLQYQSLLTIYKYVVKVCSIV